MEENKHELPFTCRDKFGYGCDCTANDEDELKEKFSFTWGGYKSYPRKDCKKCVARNKKERINGGKWYAIKSDKGYDKSDYPGHVRCRYM